MAGAGYKLFTTGQVLTAAEVNTYLQEQTVMVFNDAASRTTALSGVLAEGMVSYLKSTKVVEIYNGTAWASLDDPNAIQNTIVDAKGDLIAATGNDVPARLAVGNNGETLVADSSTSTGLRWTNVASTTNYILNGAMDFWQRSTSYALPATGSSYGAADRWYIYNNSVTGRTVSRQTASLDGFTYSQRVQRDSGNTNTGAIQVAQLIESAQSVGLQGKFVTVSFWAKAGANFSPASSQIGVTLYAGTGTDQNPYTTGYTGQTTPISTNQTITTSWARYSFTTASALASTVNELTLAIASNNFVGTAGANDWFEITGVQVEAGQVATPFNRAGRTLAGELAACQRYFQRFGDGVTNEMIGLGLVTGNIAYVLITHPVQLRGTPSLSNAANANFVITNGVTTVNPTAINADVLSSKVSSIGVSFGTTVTAGTVARWYRDGTDAAFVDFSSEL